MMTATRHPATSFTLPSGVKRFGYLLALLINGVMLFIANNLLAWGWFSWLTEDFEEVLPIITFSLAATMLANAIYLFYDAQWFKSLTQIGVTGITIAVAVRMWLVFPFDFSAYEFNWELMVRFGIGISLFGMGVGILSEMVKLGKALAGEDESTAG